MQAVELTEKAKKLLIYEVCFGQRRQRVATPSAGNSSGGSSRLLETDHASEDTRKKYASQRLRSVKKIYERFFREKQSHRTGTSGCWQLARSVSDIPARIAESSQLTYKIINPIMADVLAAYKVRGLETAAILDSHASREKALAHTAG